MSSPSITEGQRTGSIERYETDEQDTPYPVAEGRIFAGGNEKDGIFHPNPGRKVILLFGALPIGISLQIMRRNVSVIRGV